MADDAADDAAVDVAADVDGVAMGFAAVVGDEDAIAVGCDVTVLRRDAGGVVADGADGVADAESACSDAGSVNDAVADKRGRAAYATAAGGNA